jgi:hypothetical protein
VTDLGFRLPLRLDVNTPGTVDIPKVRSRVAIDLSRRSKLAMISVLGAFSVLIAKMWAVGGRSEAFVGVGQTTRSSVGYDGRSSV